MKIGKSLDITYHINEEKKVIVAVAKGTELDAINKFSHYLSMDKYGNMIFSYQKKFEMPNEFRGIARCDERDTFDIEKGKKIAKEKLYTKYCKSLHKAEERIIDALYDIMVGFEEYVDLDNVTHDETGRRINYTYKEI